MSEKGAREAIQFRPPHGNDTTDSTKNVGAALTGTSTSALATGAASASGGTFCTVSSDVAFHIRFGLSTVAAATTSDMYLPAGVYSFWCSKIEDTHFRAIKASGASDGIIRAFRSAD